jgi:hypothetical protein
MVDVADMLDVSSGEQISLAASLTASLAASVTCTAFAAFVRSPRPNARTEATSESRIVSRRVPSPFFSRPRLLSSEGVKSCLFSFSFSIRVKYKRISLLSANLEHDERNNVLQH